MYVLAERMRASTSLLIPLGQSASCGAVPERPPGGAPAARSRPWPRRTVALRACCAIRPALGLIAALGRAPRAAAAPRPTRRRPRLDRSRGAERPGANACLASRRHAHRTAIEGSRASQWGRRARASYDLDAPIPVDCVTAAQERKRRRAKSTGGRIGCRPRDRHEHERLRERENERSRPVDPCGRGATWSLSHVTRRRNSDRRRRLGPIERTRRRRDRSAGLGIGRTTATTVAPERACIAAERVVIRRSAVSTDCTPCPPVMALDCGLVLPPAGARREGIERERPGCTSSSHLVLSVSIIRDDPADEVADEATPPAPAGAVPSVPRRADRTDALSRRRSVLREWSPRGTQSGRRDDLAGHTIWRRKRGEEKPIRRSTRRARAAGEKTRLCPRPSGRGRRSCAAASRPWCTGPDRRGGRRRAPRRCRTPTPVAVGLTTHLPVTAAVFRANARSSSLRPHEFPGGSTLRESARARGGAPLELVRGQLQGRCWARAYELAHQGLRERIDREHAEVRRWKIERAREPIARGGEEASHAARPRAISWLRTSDDRVLHAEGHADLWAPRQCAQSIAAVEGVGPRPRP